MGFDGRTVQESHGFPRPPSGRFVALERQDHDVVVRLRMLLGEGKVLPARMPRRGPLRILAFRQPLRVARPVGALPVEVERRLVGPVGAEGDAAAVRRPHRPLVRGAIECQARQRVALPFVDGHVELATLLDVHRELPAIGREAEVPVAAGQGSQRLWPAFPAQPQDGHFAPDAPAGQEYERPPIREGELRPREPRSGSDALQHRDRRAAPLETTCIEGHREQRPFVHVDQVAAPEIAAVVSAALNDAPRAARQRLDDEARALEVAHLAVRRCRARPGRQGAPAASGG